MDIYGYISENFAIIFSEEGISPMKESHFRENTFDKVDPEIVEQLITDAAIATALILLRNGHQFCLNKIWKVTSRYF